MRASAGGVLLAVGGAAGHGAVIYPPTWHDPDGTIGMSRGTVAAQGCTSKKAPGEVEPAQGCAVEWYSNSTKIPGAPTIPKASPLRTYKNILGSDWTAANPWRAPGTAPVFSPCGIDGGNPHGCPVGNKDPSGCAQGGYGYGPDARTLPGNTQPTEWAAGSVVEATWSIVANHGGGYSYRLCPKPADNMDLTEDCFQKMPLDFAGDTQWIQFGHTASPPNRTAFAGMRTSTGTHPAGSQWMRNPIPACGNLGTGGATGACSGAQFPPPLPGVAGFFGIPAAGSCSSSPVGVPVKTGSCTDYQIVDKLQLPSDLPLGDYVLSFRWDCEQTPQVWNSCSDVRIVKGA